MTTISSEHLALLTATEVGAQVQVWLASEVRGVINEANITDGWLPTEEDGWEDIRQQVTSVSVRQDEDGGSRISIVIADEARSQWTDDRALAVVGVAFDGTAWQPRELLAWGYLDGSGSQDLTAAGDQSGTRNATYDGYWTRTPTPSHRFARANLATSASVAGSSDILASTSAEAGIEYIAQDNNAAAKAIDGDADSVTIFDVIADPEQPIIGDTIDPRILRVYNGNGTDVIGAGNEPKYIELWCGHNLTPWGTTWDSPPDMYNEGAGEGQPTVRDDAKLETTIVTYGDGSKALRVRSKAVPGNFNAETWIQWIVYSPYGGRPFRVSFDIKASATSSIGVPLLLTITDAAPTPGERIDVPRLLLPQVKQSYSFDFGTTGNYGGAKFSLKTGKGMLAGADDVYYDLSNLRISVGYMDEAAPGRLFLSYDNGAGVERTQRLAFDLTSPTFTIPADGSIIICDDIATFKKRFDPGNRLLIQFRNLQPLWDFGPGLGKLALRYANNPNRNQFDPVDVIDTIETIDFETNGLDWEPTQAISRQDPIGTGDFAVEDYPHIGLLPGAYGAAFLWLDLGEYGGTPLALPMTDDQMVFSADDPDQLAGSGTVYIDTEQITYDGREGQTIFVTARGANGTTPAEHLSGAAIIPKLAGAAQTGPQFDAVELRRKAGTPAILNGAVLYSNLVSPEDPSEGGAKWERHPDWHLLTRFVNTARADVLSLRPPGNIVQARHVCVVIDRMDRRDGEPQRAKINEVVVREYLPGGNMAAGWAGHGATNVAEAAAHLLTQHGGVPPSKVTITASPAPMGELSITQAKLAQMIDNLQGDGELRVWLDPYNQVYIAPDPSSPDFDAREPYVTLDNTMTIGGIGVNWTVRQPVSQVRMTAREVGALRTYRIQYPDIPAALGEVIDVKNALVRSWAEGRDKAERIWRARNTRRAPKPITIGPAPWARPYLRIVWNATGLDASDQVVGVNCCIVGYEHRFTDDGRGGLIWTTTLNLKEIIL